MENTNEQITINKKIIAEIIAVILFLIILTISVITLASTTKASNLAFVKYRFYTMKSESQPQIAEVGDLVITKKIKNGEIQKGENIVFKDDTFYYCDEIVGTKTNGAIVKIIIAEKNGVKYQFSEDDVEGKIVKTIPKLGRIIDFLRTPIGFIVYALCTILIFIMLRYMLLHKICK